MENGLLEKIKSQRRYKIGIIVLIFCAIYFISVAFFKVGNDLITGAAITYVSTILGYYFSASDDKKEEEK